MLQHKDDKHNAMLYSTIIIWCSSLIILSPNFAIYAQSEDSQADECQLPTEGVVRPR